MQSLPAEHLDASVFSVLRKISGHEVQPAKHCRKAEPAGNALAVAVHRKGVTKWT